MNRTFENPLPGKKTKEKKISLMDRWSCSPQGNRNWWRCSNRDISGMTPLDGLNFLNDMKKKAGI